MKNKLLAFTLLTLILFACSTNRYDSPSQYYDVMHMIVNPAYTDMRYLETSYYHTPKDLYEQLVDRAIDTFRFNKSRLKDLGPHDNDNNFRLAADEFFGAMIKILDEDYRPLAGLFLSGDTAAVNVQADRINAHFGAAEEKFFAVEKLFVDKHNLLRIIPGRT